MKSWQVETEKVGRLGVPPSIQKFIATLNKITVRQILTIFVTNRFPLCVATPLPEMCEMLNKITGWQILTIFVTNRFPVCVATPFKLPCSRITVPFTIRRPESEVPLQRDSYE